MISLLLTLAGYFKSRHHAYIFFWSCPYGHKFGKETNSSFLTLGRTREEGNCQTL